MITMLDRTTALTGTFSATLHDIPCEIHLHLDQTGGQCGYFTADGERLEIIGGVASTLGEFFGALRAESGETVAVFRATPHSDGLQLELDLPEKREPMKLANAERIVFQARQGAL
jgi:hypothetical protein